MPLLRFLRNHRLFTLIVGLILVGIVLFAVAWNTFGGLRIRVNQALVNVGVIPPSLPLYITTNAPADRQSDRLVLVDTLHEALAQGDHVEAARLNADLSHEAAQRALWTLKAWETLRDPETGLLPMANSTWYREWNPDAVAGNLFSHLFVASRFVDAPNQSLWDQTLATEMEMCGALPCYLDLESLAEIEQDLDSMIQGATEYGRDGLLSIIERFGEGPWFDRLVEIADAVLAEAYVETEYGLILSDGTEVNGAMMQVFVRLYWATGDERYLEMSERIADAYLFDVLPAYGGLPTDYWDFETSQPKIEDPRFRPDYEAQPGLYMFRLVDHGGEIIGGLGELYFLERMLDRPAADRYAQPLQDFYDRLLESGLNEDGLWYRSFFPATGAVFNAQLNDTWGYNLAAMYAVDMANGDDHYHAAIEDMMRAVTTQLSAPWEGSAELDGYADSIESMLYLLPWFDLPEAHYWVDREIEVMFLKQRDDGFVEGWYLDGNYVRTSLMYAQYKTMGAWLDSWTEDVRLGASYDRDADELYVYAAAAGDWDGRLRFDTPRHQSIWNLPVEYPRVNGSPEWFVVQADAEYVVTNLDTGEATTYTGQALADGLPVTFDSENDTLSLRVTAADETSGE